MLFVVLCLQHMQGAVQEVDISAYYSTARTDNMKEQLTQWQKRVDYKEYCVIQSDSSEVTPQ